jgi:hypothetical protein
MGRPRACRIVGAPGGRGATEESVTNVSGRVSAGALYTGEPMLENARQNCHFVPHIAPLGVIPTFRHPLSKSFSAKRVGSETGCARANGRPCGTTRPRNLPHRWPPMFTISSPSPSPSGRSPADHSRSARQSPGTINIPQGSCVEPHRNPGLNHAANDHSPYDPSCQGLHPWLCTGAPTGVMCRVQPGPHSYHSAGHIFRRNY